MEVKLEGFYSTVIRFNQTYQEQINLCANLMDKIQDHEKQIKHCENVDVKDLKIEAITPTVKALLLQKLRDKINDFNVKLNDSITTFKNNSELLNKKFQKCVEIGFRPQETFYMLNFL